MGHENGHFGQGGDWSAESLNRTIDRSLMRLKTDVLDIVHLHGCTIEASLVDEDLADQVWEAGIPQSFVQ